MSPRRTIALLAVVVGVLLLTNPIWVFPNEGDTRYTYERSALVVENGSFVYAGADRSGFRERNALTPIACQLHETEQPRACAFDYHLVDHGPVTAQDQLSGVEPDFARLRGGYYRRIVNRSVTDDNQYLTHDVREVAPRTILAETAVNVTGSSASDIGDLPLEWQIAITGETRSTVEQLDAHELGRIFLKDGSYYTVVATDDAVVDHGLTFLRYELPRFMLMLLGGIGVLFGSLAIRREH